MIYLIKVRLFLGILFCVKLNMLIGQDDVLRKADSLFVQQRYTEAFEEYNKSYQLGQISSAMLLKMAFIQEGLDNYVEALLYLDHYFLQSANRRAIGQIEKIAEKNGLKGYRYDDIDYFIALHYKYQYHIGLTLLVLIVLLCVYFFKNQKPVFAGIIQIIIIILLFFVVNFESDKKGIIVADRTLLRSSPSAGGEPMDFLKKGHKVKVLREDEVWVKIIWEGRDGFVKKGKIKYVN